MRTRRRRPIRRVCSRNWAPRGLLSLPQPEEWGGGGQPYEVYLQVLEEIAARWAAVAVAVSVHSLSSHPLLAFGTDEQKQRWLPGHALAVSRSARTACPSRRPVPMPPRCSARHAAFDERLRAQRLEVLDHPRRASRTSTRCSRAPAKAREGISCFLVPGRPGGSELRQARGEDGPARRAHHVGVLRQRPHLDADRLIGAEGQGLQIAFSALDSGRLGIAAVAVGHRAGRAR